MLDRFSLQGEVALLTGGAGGYGYQIAAGLAEAGACTFVAARPIDLPRA
jgi:NAD(P)-dependent dehydrogenase (short-subunit alcohol dehydrogenase family)